MKVDVVVDVGNSAAKWGRCSDNRIAAVARLPFELDAWERQATLWKLPLAARWAVAGANPLRRDELVDWLRARGSIVRVIADPREVPVFVALPHPDRVGIDRLFDAAAAQGRAEREVSKIVVDAGTAVTVDWVDEQGFFRGGSIFPGLGLMSRALREHTALLPMVESHWANPPLPGRNTEEAIKTGVFWATAGGIKALVRLLRAQAREPGRCVVYLTGGDAATLAPVMDSDVILWPEMTLEGIRIAAKALPETGEKP